MCIEGQQLRVRNYADIESLNITPVARNNNLVDQQKNWKKILLLLENFYCDVLGCNGQMAQFSSVIDERLICREESEIEIRKVLELVAGCILASPRQAELIENIMQLDADTTNQLMQLIKGTLARFNLDAAPTPDATPIKDEEPLDILFDAHPTPQPIISSNSSFSATIARTPTTPTDWRRQLCSELRRTSDLQKEDLRIQNENLKNEVEVLQQGQHVLLSENDQLRQEKQLLTKKIADLIDAKIGTPVFTIMPSNTTANESIELITPRNYPASPISSRLPQPLASPSKQKLVSLIDEREQELKQANKKIFDLLKCVDENRLLKDEIEVMKQKIVELDKTRFLVDKYKSKLEESSTWKRQISELENQVDVQLEKYIELESENDKLKKQYAQLQQYKELIAELKEDKEVLSFSLQNKTHEINKLTDTIDCLNNDLLSYKSQLQSLSRDFHCKYDANIASAPIDIISSPLPNSNEVIIDQNLEIEMTKNRITENDSPVSQKVMEIKRDKIIAQRNVEQLSLELQQCQQEVKQREQEYLSLEMATAEDRETFTRELEARCNRITELEVILAQEMKNNEQCLGELEQQIQEKQAKLKLYEQIQVELKKRVTDLETDLTLEKQETIRHVEGEKMLANELEEAHNLYEKDISQLRQEISSLRTEKNQIIQSKFEETQTVRRKFQVEIQALKEELLQKDHELSHANERLEAIQKENISKFCENTEEIGHLHQLLDALKNDKKQLDQKVNTDSRDIAVLNNNLTHQEHQIQDLEKHKLIGEETRKQLESQVAQLNVERAKSEATIATLTQQIASREQNEQQIFDDKENLKSEITALTNTIVSLTEKLQSSQHECTKLQEELTVKENEVGQRKEQLTNVRAQADVLASRLKEHTRAAQYIAEKENEFQRLKIKMEESEKFTQHLQLSIERMKQERRRVSVSFSQEDIDPEQLNLVKLLRRQIHEQTNMETMLKSRMEHMQREYEYKLKQIMEEKSQKDSIKLTSRQDENYCPSPLSSTKRTPLQTLYCSAPKSKKQSQVIGSKSVLKYK